MSLTTTARSSLPVPLVDLVEGDDPGSELRFLIDNSVWSRLSTAPAVVTAFESLITENRPSSILICPPIVAEYGYSARNGRDHDSLVKQLRAFTECPEAPTSSQALEIQNRLWNSGLLRAAGSLDTVIAAYAVVNDATVVHYDRDYEIIASVVPELKHRWIVPRGTAD